MDSARPSALRRRAVFTICDTREPAYSADDAQPAAVPAFLPPHGRTGSVRALPRAATLPAGRACSAAVPAALRILSLASVQPKAHSGQRPAARSLCGGHHRLQHSRQVASCKL